MLSCTLPSSRPTDSLAEVRKLIQECATSLASASCPCETQILAPSVPVATAPSSFPSQILPTSVNTSPPAFRFEALLSEYIAEDAARSQEERCEFCRGADHLEEDCEEANRYIRAGKCRRDMVGKFLLPSGARIPRGGKGESLRDRLEKYYRPKAAQASVVELARRRQVTAPATEARGPVLSSHSRITQEAIEPTDDYQTPKTPILSNPEPRVVPASVADTISNPPESSASERTNAPCGILPPVGNSRVIALTSIPAHAVSNDCIPVSVCNIADPRAEAGASHRVPLVPSNVSPSVPIPPSVPRLSIMHFSGPERPQLQVISAIGSRPRWPQNHVCPPTSLHVVRQLERVRRIFPTYFPFPSSVPGSPSVRKTVRTQAPDSVSFPLSVPVSVPDSPSSSESIGTISSSMPEVVGASFGDHPVVPSVRETVRTPVPFSVPERHSPSMRFSGPEWPQRVSHAITSRPRWPQCVPKSATMAAMCLKVGHDGCNASRSRPRWPQSSFSVPEWRPPSIRGSGPEWPQCVSHAVDSRLRWPQDHVIAATSIHVVRQLERVRRIFPAYFRFPLPSSVVFCTPLAYLVPSPIHPAAVNRLASSPPAFVLASPSGAS
ncbi:hypothetical protein EDB85DRAFT_2160934 [Lactarius pseudohatsudake]|nr:hypothetical protein EDB85DRAFT_2160934 [Lactarius pseudohatsudake]